MFVPGVLSLFLGCGIGFRPQDTGPFDADGDGAPARLDCDDNDATRSPDLLEICNGRDDDCDDLIDADDPNLEASSYYVDADGDGYGDDATVETLCDPPNDRVMGGGDCDDSDPAVNPDAQEICSLRDDDCDGLIDNDDDSVDPSGFGTWYPDADNDDHGVPGPTVEGCDPGEYYAPDDTDCDDSEPLAWGGAPEICGDGVDNDCDGAQGSDCGAYGLVRAHQAAGAWNGPTAPEETGAALAGVGDTDGDGIEDWVVGVPNSKLGSKVPGKIFLVRTGYWPGGDLETTAAVSWAGSEDFGRAGTALVGLGDIDGDGLADIAIGAPHADGLAEDSGVVSLVTAAGNTSKPLMEARARLLGAGVADQVGHALAAAGDPSGDGVAELLVGAFNGGGAGAPGQAFLVSGALVGQVDLATEALLVLTGEREFAYAGAAVAAGDTDGDGIPELAVGAPLDDQGGFQAGVAWLMAGGLTGSVALVDGDARIMGLRTGDMMGISVAFADLDGDGLDDLVVAAPGDSTDQEGAGVVAIFPSPAGVLTMADAAARRMGTEAFELAGMALCAGGDYNGDGQPDLVVGSPYRTIDAVGTAGAAYVVLGPISATASLSESDTRFMGGLDGDRVGAALALIGDQDGDGWGELLVGAPGASLVYSLSGGGGL